MPIIGLGGIVSAADALEYLVAGARAVGVGTAHFANPAAALKVAKGLLAYAEKENLASWCDLKMKSS